ncbi:hypothetical protein QBC34DRAFT_472474 [Podospora aff. communis PSN243]|uniref:NB-ARC domain-containing protein n=1 Tax=Podospora aff. communis PSN243 TaxID=3040156 RepID=A0AAV9GAK7_9PEZI|nr:hypothetical protein QBC34DRAFT_472474 [Podospora aff. communis PSN243]
MQRLPRRTSPADAWQAALDRAKLELGEADFSRFVSGHTFSTCVQAVTNEQKRLPVRFPEYFKVMKPILDFLHSFERAINSLCHSHPEVSCLVWGSVQFLVIIASKFSKCRIAIAEMLESLTRAMPRFEQYASLFPTHGRLHLRLVDIYKSFVLFCVGAFKFFKTKPWCTRSILTLAFLDMAIKLAWKSLDDDFSVALVQIQRDAQEFEHEANASNVAAGFEREAEAQTRHDDIMQAISRCANTNNLKPYFAIPHARNVFQGREVELDQLHRALGPPTGAATREDLRSVCIQGLGGMGKTTLASEYAYRFRSAYAAVFWLKAESGALLQHDYHVQVIKYLQTTNGSGVSAEETDLQKLSQAAKRWLSTTDTSWLLILDNVEDSATRDVLKFWPTSGKGAIILTTRDRDVADVFSSTILRLEGLNDDQGSSLLLSQAGLCEPPSDTSKKIANELGGLPLAICQMGSYARQTNCTLQQVHDLLRGRMSSGRLYSDKNSISGLQYADTIASCCELSFARLSERSRHLLSVLAFFQTDAIDERVITEGCVAVPRLRHLADPLEWNNAVRALIRYDLISRRIAPDGLEGEHLIGMHRVVKLHALHTLEGKHRLPTPGTAATSQLWFGAFEDAVGLLSRVFPCRPQDGGTMCKNWPACAKWLPHVPSMKEELDLTRSYIISPPPALRGLLVDSLEMSDLSIPPHNPDPIKADAATIIGALQLSAFTTRSKCLGMFQKALHWRCRWLEPVSDPSRNDLLQLANAYNNTGAAHLAVDEFDDALSLFQMALDIKLSLGDERSNPYAIGLSYYNISRAEMGQGRVFQALEHCRRAVRLVECANGRDDYRSNQFRFTLAELLMSCGHLEAGLRAHEETLAVQERVMGRRNNDTGVSYYGVACAYERIGCFNDALDNVEYAIEAFGTCPDSDDRLARCFFKKSLVLRSLLREADAEEALIAAQTFGAKLQGSRDWTGDRMEDYDSLVSYCNK